jgi:hypothetical protein
VSARRGARRRRRRNVRRRKAGRLLGSVKAWFAAVGVIAGAVGAVLAVVLIFFPGLRPCFGDATAEFQGVVVRKVGRLDFDLSYTVKTHGYAGKSLSVRWTLFRVDPNGILTPIPDFGDLPGGTLKPTSCSSDQGGADISVSVLETGSYQVLLELFPPGHGARITGQMVDLGERLRDGRRSVPRSREAAPPIGAG